MHKGLKSVCFESKEKFFLANSKDLIQTIIELNLQDYYGDMISEKDIAKY
jgi:hypothetical protein